MRIYIGIDYDLIENNSKIYYNGSIWDSNQFGKFEIIGKTNIKTKSFNRCWYKHFLIKFINTKYYTIKNSTQIKSGQVRDKRVPSVCGIGYLGGEVYDWSNSKNEYMLWQQMITRCYNENHQKTHPSYVGCKVDKRWHNFQNFYKDIREIENHDEWLRDSYNWQLDKDIKIHGNRLYSKDTCIFATIKNNMRKRKKPNKIYNFEVLKIGNSDRIKIECLSEFLENHSLVESIFRYRANKNIPYNGWLIYKTKMGGIKNVY